MNSMDRVLIKIKKWQELRETFVYRIELVPLTLQLHRLFILKGILLLKSGMHLLISGNLEHSSLSIYTLTFKSS